MREQVDRRYAGRIAEAKGGRGHWRQTVAAKHQRDQNQPHDRG